MRRATANSVNFFVLKLENYKKLSYYNQVPQLKAKVKFVNTVVISSEMSLNSHCLPATQQQGAVFEFR